MCKDWLEKYRRMSEKWRFISKLTAFFISLFLVLSIYDTIHFFYYNPKEFSFQFIFEIGLLTAVIFQVLLLIIFSARFILLFFKTEKKFWISQSLSLIGLILLALYLFTSMPEETPFGIYSMIPPGYFSHTARGFDVFGLYYLILSPLKLFIVSIIAFVKSK